MSELAGPSFVVIGAAKAGTTSLYHYLSQHPDIFMSPIKETNFWLTRFEQGRPNFEDLDVSPAIAQQLLPPTLKVTTYPDYLALFANRQQALACGEASPLYMHSLVAPHSIRQALPKIKLVAVLRNPVERAYSDYQMRVRKGEAVGEFLAGNLDDLFYLKGGFYAQALSRYFDEFPADQIKVILYDALCRNPAETLQELFEFLGVPSTFEPDTQTRHNTGGVPSQSGIYHFLINSSLGLKLKAPFKGLFSSETRKIIRKKINQAFLKKPDPLSPAAKRRLVDLYREDVLSLQALLNTDLSDWLTIS